MKVGGRHATSAMETSNEALTWKGGFSEEGTLDLDKS